MKSKRTKTATAAKPSFAAMSTDGVFRVNDPVLLGRVSELEHSMKSKLKTHKRKPKPPGRKWMGYVKRVEKFRSIKGYITLRIPATFEESLGWETTYQ